MDGISKTIRRTEIGNSPAAGQRSRALGWFGRICSHCFFSTLKADLGIRERTRIFSFPVTVWLMMAQRLSGGTLASALGELLNGNGWSVLEPCKRVLESAISSNTGGYSQARSRVTVEAARRVVGHTFDYLSAAMAADPLRDRLFLVDGSSIRLAHTPALLKVYGPAKNQHGDSHWPIMRVVTMHHVVTGLALAPCYGPMYGNHAVGEQELAGMMIGQLPPASVLIGDRNFGVFWLMWQACAQGHDVLVRMQRERAAQLGAELKVNTDQAVEWRPSPADLKAHPELPQNAYLNGRLVVVQPEDAGEPLYLFTTLEQRPETVASLYKERWNIETDLRSLKEQMKLHSLTAKSPVMAAVELLFAVAAYNLIRAVMEEAARQAGVEPRRLSYSRSQACFWPFLRAVSGACTLEEFDIRWKRLIRALGQCKLPTRSRPSAPRSVWPKRSAFPLRKTTRGEN